MRTFKDYYIHRFNEEQQVHNMSHDEAMKWVLSALDILDNPDPSDKSQQKDINAALSTPLSAYPEKLDSVASQLQLRYSSDWPKIEALLASPENTTVSKLIAVLGSKAAPKRTVTEPDKHSDDAEEGQDYSQPDGTDPL